MAQELVSKMETRSLTSPRGGGGRHEFPFWKLTPTLTLRAATTRAECLRFARGAGFAIETLSLMVMMNRLSELRITNRDDIVLPEETTHSQSEYAQKSDRRADFNPTDLRSRL